MSLSNSTGQMQSTIRSPWLSGQDLDDSDAYLDQSVISGADLKTMDLSWLTANQHQATFHPEITNLNMHQHQPHPFTQPHPTFTHPQQAYTHHHSSSLPTTSTHQLSNLLSSDTAYHCREILEDPIRRKPGRKPKGPLPDAFLAHLDLLDGNHNLIHSMDNDSMRMNGGVVDKKEERKFKNREAADQSRKRLKDRGRVLEEFTTTLEQENEALRVYLRGLQSQRNGT